MGLKIYSTLLIMFLGMTILLRRPYADLAMAVEGTIVELLRLLKDNFTLMGDVRRLERPTVLVLIEWSKRGRVYLLPCPS